VDVIKLTAQTDSDGNLQLDIPVGVSNAKVVIVIARPCEEADAYFEGIENGWPPGFLEQTYGSLADDPIERPSQGGYEVREESW